MSRKVFNYVSAIITAGKYFDKVTITLENA